MITLLQPLMARHAGPEAKLACLLQLMWGTHCAVARRQRESSCCSCRRQPVQCLAASLTFLLQLLWGSLCSGSYAVLSILLQMTAMQFLTDTLGFPAAGAVGEAVQCLTANPVRYTNNATLAGSMAVRSADQPTMTVVSGVGSSHRPRHENSLHCSPSCAGCVCSNIKLMHSCLAQTGAAHCTAAPPVQVLGRSTAGIGPTSRAYIKSWV